MSSGGDATRDDQVLRPVDSAAHDGIRDHMDHFDRAVRAMVVVGSAKTMGLDQAERGAT